MSNEKNPNRYVSPYYPFYMNSRGVSNQNFYQFQSNIESNQFNVIQNNNQIQSSIEPLLSGNEFIDKIICRLLFHLIIDEKPDIITTKSIREKRKEAYMFSSLIMGMQLFTYITSFIWKIKSPYKGINKKKLFIKYLLYIYTTYFAVRIIDLIICKEEFEIQFKGLDNYQIYAKIEKIENSLKENSNFHANIRL